MSEGNEKTTRNLAKRTHEMLVDMAQKDLNTGILNKRGVLNMSEQIVKSLNREGIFPNITVVMMDMIGLKSLNQKYNAIVADELILESTARTSSVIRESDLYGRWTSGDEFVIISFDNNLSGTRQMIDKIKSSQPDEVNYNFVYKEFNPGVDIGRSVDFVFSNLEEIKKGLNHDVTGRVIGDGVVVQLD